MNVKAVITAAVPMILVSITISAMAIPSIAAAHTSNGVGGLANMAQVQQLSVATDGLYAPSIASLTDGGFGRTVHPEKGSQVSYLPNKTRTHYVSATKLPSGRVVVSSDENASSVTCLAYNSTCIAEVSTDATLVTAAPKWVSF